MILPCLWAVLDQNAASIPVLEGIQAATATAQPEMLNGMSIGGFLTGWMILVETKELTLLVIKGSLAIGVRTN